MRPAAVERLPWDSAFFGVPIGRLHLERLADDSLEMAVQRADAEGVDCLYLLVDAREREAAVAAERVGFRVYDVRIELERTHDGQERMPGTVRLADADDRPVLDRLARNRFSDTRFFADPHFPRQRVAELYVAWLDRAFATPGERSIFVTEDVEGFVIVRGPTADEPAAIELIAVDEEAAGRGIGSSLVAAAHGSCVAGGGHRTTVVTQGANIAAQRLYQRCGYRTVATRLWLHRWAER